MSYYDIRVRLGLYDGVQKLDIATCLHFLVTYQVVCLSYLGLLVYQMYCGCIIALWLFCS